MVNTVKGVAPDKLIDRVAEYLKTSRAIEPPPWAPFVKTSMAREHPPVNPDWWFVRAASIIRKLYLLGPIGVSRLRTYYGGRHRPGMRPPKHVKGGGAIIRRLLQQLEKAGLVTTVGRKGRALTPKGKQLLEQAAKAVSSKR
jgi:small subunit ribosomal protein S19e